ncbi:hypothetical protein ACTL6U_10820 [Rhodovibrionaceae bacterium A322]
MYNAQKPSVDELPSTARLLWSTAIAFVTACVILIGAVLPAEYGIDPTGLGRLLGLKDMGEIKVQLSAEAEADRQAAAASASAPQVAKPSTVSAQEASAQQVESEQAESQQSIKSMTQVVSSAQAKTPAADPVPVETPAVEPQAAPLQTAESSSQSNAVAAPVAPVADVLPWRDEISFTLTPGEGIEIKLVMAGQAEAYYAWSTDKGVVNYDTHGDGGGRNISYEKGRGVASDEGLLKAAFTGNHGWFWRNRTKEDVTVTLKTRGDYKRIKR